MGCGASVGHHLGGGHKYQLGPLETPTGDAPKPKSKKPLLAPIDVADGMEMPPSAEKAADQASKEAHAKVPRLDFGKENMSNLPLPPKDGNVPQAPKEMPPDWMKDQGVKPLPKNFKPMTAGLLKSTTWAGSSIEMKPLRIMPDATPFRPAQTHPTLHCGVEKMVERQQAAAQDLQLELRGSDRQVRQNVDGLRHLWRDICSQRARACAAEAQIEEILAELVTGEQKAQFEEQRRQLHELEGELSVESEKSQRWLSLARGLQGKFDALVIEGLVEAVSPAGILFSPHLSMRGGQHGMMMHGMHQDDSDSDVTPRYAGMGLAQAA